MNITVIRGNTLRLRVRWATNTIKYLPINSVVGVAPLRLSVTAHGLPQGWPVAITRCRGMTAINASNDPPKDKDYLPVSVIDANTLEFNSINATGYPALTAGSGVLMAKTPVDLTGAMITMQVRDDSGNLLFATTPKQEVYDPVTSSVSIRIEGADVKAWTFDSATYAIEAVFPDGTVSEFITGTITVLNEVVK